MCNRSCTISVQFAGCKIEYLHKLAPSQCCMVVTVLQHITGDHMNNNTYNAAVRWNSAIKMLQNVLMIITCRANTK